MPWLQLTIHTQRQQIEAIEDDLLSLGAISVTLKEHIPEGREEQPILEPELGETPLWDNASIVGLFDANCDTNKLSKQLQQSLPQPLSLRWEQLEDKDWEREWIKNYHPIQCADKLWICPSWLDVPDPSATNLLLDPGLAFGTGTHPTTFLCMQWLANQALEQIDVLDYGCGSGILGITALLLGAKQAVGVDIDPQALIASRANAERNHIETNAFPVFLPDDYTKHQIKHSQPVDIVVANILAGPLVELKPTLLKPLKTDGLICLSGILKNQAQHIQDAYQDSIQFDAVAEKEDWVRLSGRKKHA